MSYIDTFALHHLMPSSRHFQTDFLSCRIGYTNQQVQVVFKKSTSIIASIEMKYGIIHYRNIRNSMFVVKLDDKSFSVFESFNVNEFNVGDMISGQLDKCGFFHVLNANTQKSQLVHIQNIECGETSAIEKANTII